MAVSDHRILAPTTADVRVAVLTVSDTRVPDTDEGGGLVETLTRQAGFSVSARELVRDDLEAIATQVRAWCASGDIDVVLATGGTGVAPRDRTVEAVAPLFDRTLEGFGELFRALSFAQIGPAAMLSRASAGIAGDTAIFLMPGSPAAVRLALERLILPELTHLVGQLRRPGAAASRNLGGAGAASTGPEPKREPPPEHRHHTHHSGHDDPHRH